MSHPATTATAPLLPSPPRRAARRPAAVVGSEANVNRYIAAYIMGVANRLANGASAHYRKKFNLGMSEWRTIMAIGTSDHRIVREVAEKADLDYAAASKSLRVLEDRGLVTIEHTSRRGRAAIAKLTDEGLILYRKLLESSRKRQKRLLSGFSQEEIHQLWSLLRRIEEQVPFMNADS